MKKNGFVSVTIIYTFFTTFLLLLVFLLNSYARADFLTEQIKQDIKDEPKDLSADINLSVCVRDSESSACNQVNEVPKGPFELKTASCDDNMAQNSIKYSNGRISFRASSKVNCSVELVPKLLDININMFINNKDKNKDVSEVSMENFVRTYTMPNRTYKYLPNLTKCTTLAGTELNPNDYEITLNESTEPREFELETKGQIVCNTYFVRKSADIELHIFMEDSNGTNLFGSNGKTYKKVNSINEIPVDYTFNKITDKVCTPEVAEEDFMYNSSSRDFEIYASEKTECSVYFSKP